MQFLGAPIGKFLAVRYRLPSIEDTPDGPGIHLADVRDLPGLEPLLAVGHDHASRLRNGDVCLWMESEGHPVGLVWLNVVGHSDRHFGDWSRPSGEWSYLNQLIVDPAARGMGVATSLVRSLQHVAYRKDLNGIHTVVLHDNLASRRVFQKCEGSNVGWLVGLRLGGLGTLRVALPPVLRSEP